MSPACIRSSQGPRAPQGQVLASRAALLPGQTAAPGARRSTEISRNKHPQHPKHQPRCEQAAEVKAELPKGSTGWGCGVSPKRRHTVTEQEELLQRAGGRGRLCATKIPGGVSSLLTRTEICWSPGFGHTRVTRGGTQRRCFPASPGLSACTSAAAGPARAPGIPAWPRQAAGAELSLASW